MSTAMMSAPCSANATAWLRPCPRAAPVMTATVLSSSPMTGNVPGDSSQNDGDSGRFCQDFGVSDTDREITNLIYHYAEILDGGDLDGVAELFAHGRICGAEGGPPETVFEGAAGVRKVYELATRLYEGRTPNTRQH